MSIWHYCIVTGLILFDLKLIPFKGQLPECEVSEMSICIILFPARELDLSSLGTLFLKSSKNISFSK
jgi:hypothetical protein